MNDKDILVVGAGISGICAAAYLRMRCPGRSFSVLEGRSQLGGTWDLFRYPGIRSDSDMFTLGYSFHPWKEAAAIADGPAILRYLEETVAVHGLREHIEFDTRVQSASWSSQTQRWTVVVERTDTGITETLRCRFLWGCTGYYRYDAGYTPEFPGRERFEGDIIHPQHWPEGYDYAGKRVVVIGSGATAITVVPAMSETAAHVTMLQRSPSYILSWPREDPLVALLDGRLPEKTAHAALRLKNVLLLMASYQFSKRFPRQARRFFIDRVRKELGESFDVERHFTPDYDPWDQRVCVVPEGDFFEALKAGRTSVVTDTIDTFTDKGIQLASGVELQADVIVTATGLQLQVMGGVDLDVDGTPVSPTETLMYRGTMLSGVPNFALSLGYTNASWTLKCELVAKYVCRLLNHMDAQGYAMCEAQQNDPTLEAAPLIDLQSGYIQRAQGVIPKQGARAPWRLAQNYFVDQALLRFSRLDDGVLHFR
ncbi:MAG: NAD(P)/FAD-dependent oxidoreductase [Myxococcales bacterium]|nr:NAD(P)/FAD-dependent oxidoreductase [Myxococcales bacterium]